MTLPDYPAVLVSWDVATAFSEHFSLRLPTEAEWEYAARAGVTTRYPWGNDITEGGGWGNGFDAPVKRTYPEMDWEAFPWDDGWEATAPVGTFRRNAWGFYDMFGNAWEWVFDGLDDELYSTLAPSVTDPVHSDGENRIPPWRRHRQHAAGVGHPLPVGHVHEQSALWQRVQSGALAVAGRRTPILTRTLATRSKPFSNLGG